jgi:hypothetical protein
MAVAVHAQFEVTANDPEPPADETVPFGGDSEYVQFAAA